MPSCTWNDGTKQMEMVVKKTTVTKLMSHGGCRPAVEERGADQQPSKGVQHGLFHNWLPAAGVHTSLDLAVGDGHLWVVCLAVAFDL